MKRYNIRTDTDMEEREGERLKFSHRDIALYEFKRPKPVPDRFRNRLWFSYQLKMSHRCDILGDENYVKR